MTAQPKIKSSQQPATPEDNQALEAAPLRIVIVGHVDHGKSTLVGRLFHDTGSLPEGKKEAIEKSCERRGVPFEWAFLMDAFKSERDQNITIDTAQIWFATDKRRYVIIDAPGHKEFLKNMITGAAQADAALLLIAADEGVQEQSRRHGYLLSMLGVKQVFVVVNKMDRVGYDQAVFDNIEREYRQYLSTIGVDPLGFIPVSARDGDNVAERSPHTGWYGGGTITDVLDDFEVPARDEKAPLRFYVQDIYRFDHRRILAGRIESGSLSVGDKLVFLPGGKESTVQSIETWSAPDKTTAVAGESVGITLAEQIFVERGHVAAQAEGEQRAATSNRVKARVFWMGQKSLDVGRPVKIKLCTAEVPAKLARIDRVFDASTLEVHTSQKDKINKNDVAEVEFVTEQPIAFDAADVIAPSGRFVVVDGYDLAGGGVIYDAPYDVAADAPAAPSHLPVSSEERSRRFGHQGGVVWLSGKGPRLEFARALERQLFDAGFATAMVDDGLLEGADNRAVLACARQLAKAGLLCIAIPPERVVPRFAGVAQFFPVRVGREGDNPEALVVDPEHMGLTEAAEAVLEHIGPRLKRAAEEWFYEI